ncbi:MAG: lipoyl(octanoyl) transferase LipB [Candidatus Dormibacteria bacterium]
MTESGRPTLQARWLGTVPYRDAWALQQELARQRRDDEIGDQLLLLEHPPVYTMGRAGDPAHLGAGPAALRAAGAEYIDVDRGGSVTFHGPGQLVAYPILKLRDIFPIPGHLAHGDVVAYVRALEEAVIITAAREGIHAERRPSFTGVWVGSAKLAAIGVKVAGGVTLHGLALNACTDLSWFERVTPCGIDDATATSFSALGVDATPRGLATLLATDLAAVFDRRLVRSRSDEPTRRPAAA